MACFIDVKSKKKMEWVIPKELSNEHINKLMNKNFEYAGAYSLKYTGKSEKICDATKCEVKEVHDTDLEKINQGNASSVKTIDGYCNFHTHPFPCYNGEKTIWGWPSGEDMRECVGFGLRGNLFHMVYALEGIYTIQVNPNILSCLSNDKYIETIMPNSDLSAGIIRGILVKLIECYFIATHGHRTKKYNVKFGGKTTKNNLGICTPKDWIGFANKFNFSNMVSVEENKCSMMLPCNRFPEFNQKKAGTISLRDFIGKYDFEIYDIDEKGKIRNITEDNKELIKNYIFSNFDVIVNNLNSIPVNLSYGGEKWSKGQWFHTKIFYNKFKCGGVLKSFEEFIKDKNKKCNKVLCENIFNFWRRCEKDKSIEFQDVKIIFKPFKPKCKSKSCNIFKGDDIRKWWKKQHKNKY